MVDFNNIAKLFSGYAAESQKAARATAAQTSPLANFNRARAPQSDAFSSSETVGRALAAPRGSNSNTIVSTKGNAGLDVFSAALRGSTRPGFTTAA